MEKPPIRFWIAVMVFLTTYVNYSMRANFSVSIIAMVQKHGAKDIPECKRNFSIPLISNLSSNAENTTEKYILADDKFDWNENVQGLLLGAYFYGYVISCVPGGIISEWIGPFNTILWAHIFSIILNSSVVFITYIFKHWSMVFMCRFLLGLMGGVVYPALHCLISRWAPPNEKGKFVGALMGNTLGTCLTWPFVGAITEKFGWDWGFHVLSIQCGIFCFVFWMVASDTPTKHRWISEEEKEFILESQGGSVTTQKRVPPYRSIFTSVPFWGLTVAHFGNLWGLYLFVTGAPKFISEVLGFNLKNSGLLAALPFIVRLFSGMMFGSVGDYLRKNDKFSVTVLRKSFVLFSHLLPSFFLVMMMFVGCNWKAAIALLVLAQMMNGAVVVTNLQNAQDLAPNYAGSIFGIISLIGGFTGFLTPSVTGYLIKNNNGIEEWQWNFLVGAMVYAFCGIVFIIFGSGAKQKWNDKLPVPL